jgi:hypothetical protein
MLGFPSHWSRPVTKCRKSIVGAIVGGLVRTRVTPAFFNAPHPFISLLSAMDKFWWGSESVTVEKKLGYYVLFGRSPDITYVIYMYIYMYMYMYMYVYICIYRYCTDGGCHAVSPCQREILSGTCITGSRASFLCVGGRGTRLPRVS